MNTEIPNNTPTTETPVEPVVTPVVENPVPTEVPSDTLNAAPAVAPVTTEAAPVAPVVEDSTPNLGFGAPPVNAPGEPTSITPVEPVEPAALEAAPVAPGVEPMAADVPVTPVEPVAPVAPETVPVAPVAEPMAADVPVTPAEPVTPVAPETVPVAPVAEPMAADVPVTPAEPVAPVAPEIAPVAPVAEPMAADVPVTPAEPVAPVAPEIAPVAPTAEPMAADVPVTPAEPVAPVAPETVPVAPTADTFTATSAPTVPPQGGLTVEPMPSATNTIADQNITPAGTDVTAPKKKGKGPIVIIIVIIAILLLAVGGWFVYTKVLLTPEKVYETTIKELFKAAKTETDNNKLVGLVLDSEKPFTIDGTLTLDSSSEELEILKNYKLDFSLGADYKNNKLLAGGTLSENDTEVFEGNLYLVDGNAYLEAEKLYDKILDLGDTGIDLNELIQNNDQEDLDKLYETLENALIKAINAGEISKTSTKFNGKSVTDNTFAINDSNYGAVVKAFLTEIKNDDAALESIATLTESEKDDIVSALDSAINSEMTDEIGINIKLHMYTGGLMGDTLYGIAFESDDTTILTMNIDGEDYTLNVTVETLKLDIVKKGNVTTITYTLDGTEENTITATVTQSDTNINIVVKMTTYTYTIDLTTKEIDGGYNEVLKVSLADSETSMDLSATLNLNIKQTTFEIPDVSKAVDSETLSNDDLQIIQANLSNSLGKTEIYSYILSMSNYLNTDDDYYYDDDDEFENFSADLEDSLVDYKWAAFDAYDMDEMTSDTICFSTKYLVSKGYLDEDYSDYTGSVMIQKGKGTDSDTYYIWVSDGESSYKKVDYLSFDYELSTDKSASNNCDGLATYNCTDDGKCS